MATVFNNRLTKCLKIQQLALVPQLSPVPGFRQSLPMGLLGLPLIPLCPRARGEAFTVRSDDVTPTASSTLRVDGLQAPRRGCRGAGFLGLYPALQPHLFTRPPRLQACNRGPLRLTRDPVRPCGMKAFIQFPLWGGAGSRGPLAGNWPSGAEGPLGTPPRLRYCQRHTDQPLRSG